MLGKHWFLFRTDTEVPLTADGAIAATDGFDNAETEVVGFMVVTQTCDIVRQCVHRPFVEVCPLVEVDEQHHTQIERGNRPNYAVVPALRAPLLVADLDRVMTVEKSVLVRWDRVSGYQTDAEMRRLSLALARKRARTAFPDDFVRFANPLKERMLEKHDRNSEEGRALRALREIRIRAEPSWNAESVRLFFWLVRDDDASPGDATILLPFLRDWLRRIPPDGRFVEVDGVVASLDDMTSRDYVESDPLDLDHLSTR